MPLTIEELKTRLNKNGIFDEVIDILKELSKDPGGYQAMLAELEDKYSRRDSTAMQKVRAKKTELEQIGNGKLSEARQRRSDLEKELKTVILPQIVQSTQDEIRIIQEKLLKGRLSKEEKERLNRKINDLQIECEKKCYQCGVQLEEQCDKEIADIQRDYFWTEEALLSRRRKEQDDLYQKRRQEYLSLIENDVKQAVGTVCPEGLEALCRALIKRGMSNAGMWEGEIRTLQVGYCREKADTLASVVMEAIAEKCPYLVDQNQMEFCYPYSVSRDDGEPLPQFVYKESNKSEIWDAMRKVCAAVCLQKAPAEVRIFCSRKDAKSLLPSPYSDRNPELICPIEPGDAPELINRLEQWCHSASDSSMTSDKPYYLYVFRECPEELSPGDMERMTWLMENGGRLGVRILGCFDYKKVVADMTDAGKRLKDHLDHNALGLEEDGSFRRADRDEAWVIFDKWNKEIWEHAPVDRLLHNRQALSRMDEGFLTHSAESTEPPAKQDPNHGRPEESSDTPETFLSRFLTEDRYLLPGLYFPVSLEGKNVRLDENTLRVDLIAGTDLNRREAMISYILMELILDRERKVLEGKNTAKIFFFNLCECETSYNEDHARQIGLWCCDKIIYVTPEQLKKGLEKAVESIAGAHEGEKPILIFSGMEYWDRALGGIPEQASAIEALMRKLTGPAKSRNSRQIYTGDTSLIDSVLIPADSHIKWLTDKNQVIDKWGRDYPFQTWDSPALTDVNSFIGKIEGL